MEKLGLYLNAHIFVAAIRVLQHLNGTAPSVDGVADFISLSVEQANFLCRKLTEMDIIEVVEGSYGTRLFIKNHLLLENIPADEPEDKMAQELTRFQENQKEKSKKLEAIKAEQEAKKKSKFSDIEKKLQEEIKKKENSK